MLKTQDMQVAQQHHLAVLENLSWINGQWWLRTFQPGQGIVQWPVSQQIAMTLNQRWSTLPNRRGWWIYVWLGLGEGNRVVSSRLVHAPWRWTLIRDVFNHAYQPDQVVELTEALGRIETFLLQHFVWSVFSDRSIVLPFVQRPGSVRNHHSWPGELPEHTLEVVRLVERQLADPVFALTQAEMDLTRVAALLHDVGKVMTHDDTPGKLSCWGWMTDHEALSLLVISDYLKRLNAAWPWAAASLAHILTWRATSGHCRYVAGHLVKAADQLSAHMSNRHRAFASQPDHYRLGKTPDTRSTHARL